MGSKETRQIYIRTCIDRSALVALSAQPPGVNELCVCVCNPTQETGLLHVSCSPSPS
jgi:hypothetical protein